MHINSRIHRWFGTGGSSGSDSSVVSSQLSGEAGPSDLDAIRNAMLLAVVPCNELHRLRAADQIRHAKSVVELWLMRADIFQYLAQDLGQMAAARQIAELMPLFRGHVPAEAARPSHKTTVSVARPLHKTADSLSFK